MKKSLFQIEQDYINLLDIIESNEGELVDNTEELLTINQEEFEEKLINYKHVINAIEASNNFIKDEKARLDDRIKINLNKIKKLKEAQITALKLFGEKDPKSETIRYSGETFKASTYANKHLNTIEEEVNDLIKSWKYELADGKIPKDFDNTLYTVSLQIMLPKLDVISKLVELVKVHNCYMDIIITPDKKLILKRLKEDESIKGYKIKETDIIRFT